MDTTANPQLSNTEVDAINAAVGLPPHAERRRHARHPVPLGFWLSIRLRAADGVSEVFKATARDLSASGIAFHHTGPVAEGAACDIEIRTLRGEPVTIPGAVVRCRRVEGWIHDIAVEFHFEIDPAEFVVIATPTATQAATGAIGAAEAVATRLIGELASMVDRRDDWERLSEKVREVQKAIIKAETPKTPAVKPTKKKRS